MYVSVYASMSCCTESKWMMVRTKVKARFQGRIGDGGGGSGDGLPSIGGTDALTDPQLRRMDIAPREKEHVLACMCCGAPQLCRTDVAPRTRASKNAQQHTDTTSTATAVTSSRAVWVSDTRSSCNDRKNSNNYLNNNTPTQQMHARACSINSSNTPIQHKRKQQQHLQDQVGLQVQPTVFLVRRAGRVGITGRGERDGQGKRGQ